MAIWPLFRKATLNSNLVVDGLSQPLFTAGRQIA
jgi:hypothetical protein